MFKNILIAEDHQSASISVRKCLEDLDMKEVDYVYYCDEALLKIQKRLRERDVYDLLITDLVFEADEHYPQQLACGQALIAAARELQPGLKILVFSAEHRPAVIEELFEKYTIDAYVRKARNDADELKNALSRIAQGRTYRSFYVRQSIRQKNAYDFTNFDLTIISLLSGGMLQKDIPVYLAKNNIQPCSLSSVEKRLNHIKAAMEFSKNEQLVAFCKETGLI